LSSAVNQNCKSAIKFEKKAIRKTQICENKTQKNSKFQRKQATCKSSKNPATPQKTNSRENRKVGHTVVQAAKRLLP